MKLFAAMIATAVIFVASSESIAQPPEPKDRRKIVLAPHQSREIQLSSKKSIEKVQNENASVLQVQSIAEDNTRVLLIGVSDGTSIVQLTGAAGMKEVFEVSVVSSATDRHPELAPLLRQAVKEIHCEVKVMQWAKDKKDAGSLDAMPPESAKTLIIAEFAAAAAKPASLKQSVNGVSIELESRVIPFDGRRAYVEIKIAYAQDKANQVCDTRLLADFDRPTTLAAVSSDDTTTAFVLHLRAKLASPAK